jgi:ABC-type transport system involved in cytochrome bd biosynthesis fused ATPase/permease subunit
MRRHAGHTGRLCSSCAEGHTIQGHFCKPCEGTASPTVQKALSAVVTASLIGLLVAWLSRPYFHEKEEKLAKAIAAKTARVYRRINSKYRRQLKRHESKINRGLDKAQSKIQRNVEMQVRASASSPSVVNVVRNVEVSVPLLGVLCVA